MNEDCYHGIRDPLMISSATHQSYTSIGPTGALLDQGLIALSMHAPITEELAMQRSDQEVHHQYHLVPQTNINAVDENSAKLMERYPIQFHPVASMPDLFNLLGDRNIQIDSIALDAEVLYEQGSAGMLDLMNTLKTIMRCNRRRPDGDADDAIIVVSAGRKTPVTMLRELVKVAEIRILCMRGGDASFDEVCDTVERVLRKEHHIAESIKQLMNGSRKTIPNRDGIHLTTRQRQVLELIKTRGSSNKQIARLLDLSESTVKLHIGQILKKYGCTNRTQLALTATKQKP